MSNQPLPSTDSRLRKVDSLQKLLVPAASVAFFLWVAPILVSLHQRWLTSGFEHGYPIAVMSLILLFLALRDRTMVLEEGSKSGLFVLIVCVMLTALAQAATVAIIPQVLFPLAILAFCSAVFGPFTARAIAAPILFIYFAIPFWQLGAALETALPSLNEGLRIMTTVVASALVRATGIPAFIDRDYIQVTAGTFEIAEGCSGRAYFIVGVELALFYGIAFLRRWKFRILLVAITALFSLVANWLRVVALILIGHFTAMQSPLIPDHEMFGWFVFLVVPVIMVVVGRRLELREETTVAQDEIPVGRPTKSSKWTVLAAIAILVFGILLNMRVALVYSMPAVATGIEFPVLPNWRMSDPWTGDSRPKFRGAASENATWYRRGEARVGAYVANYPVQRQGSEAVHFSNAPAGLSGPVDEGGLVRTTTATGTSYVFREYRSGAGETTRLVWLGVRIADLSANSALRAKTNQILGVLRGRVDAQVVVLSSDCANDECEDARARLQDFSREALSKLYEAAAASSTY